MSGYGQDCIQIGRSKFLIFFLYDFIAGTAEYRLRRVFAVPGIFLAFITEIKDASPLISDLAFVLTRKAERVAKHAVNIGI